MKTAEAGRPWRSVDSFAWPIARSGLALVKDRPGHDRRNAVNSAKIRQELGWAAAFTFEQGLRETVRWYLDHQPWVRTVLGQSPQERTSSTSPGPASVRPFATPGGGRGSPPGTR